MNFLREYSYFFSSVVMTRKAEPYLVTAELNNTYSYSVQYLHMFWAARGQHMPPAGGLPSMPVAGN